MKDTTHRIAIGFGAFIVLTVLLCVIAKVMMNGKEDAGASKVKAVEKTAASENSVVKAEKSVKPAEKQNEDTSKTQADKDKDAAVNSTDTAPDKSADASDGTIHIGGDTSQADSAPAGTDNVTSGSSTEQSTSAGSGASSVATASGSSSDSTGNASSGSTGSSSSGRTTDDPDNGSSSGAYVRMPDTEIELIDRPTDGRKVVCIDPAHQTNPDNTLEPLGPGSSKTKVSVTWGAEGAVTGIREYKYTLEIGLKLRDELEARGYYVYMTRTTNDVHISDVTRARMANANADIVIHIHANASEDDTQRGIMAFYPSEDNPYSAKYSNACKKLATAVLRGAAEATGALSRGVIDLDDQTSLNWTTIPAAHIETGFLSTPEEEAVMLTDQYKADMVQGIADGIDLYFGN